MTLSYNRQKALGLLNVDQFPDAEGKSDELLDDLVRSLYNMKSRDSGKLYGFIRPPEQKKEILLPCGFFPQTDNIWRSPRLRPDNTCSCSSTAAFIDAVRPELKLTDDEYIKAFYEGNYGDTTDHRAHVRCAREVYGVETEYHEDFSFNRLDTELEAGRLVIIAFLHRGPESAPTGGHVAVCRGVTGDRQTYFVMDPYGSLNDGYQGPVENGKCAPYKRSTLQARWYAPPGYPVGGFARTFKGLVDPKA